MKRVIWNIIFYSICFILVAGSIYRLAFTVPPQPGMPGFEGYRNSSLIVSGMIGLLVVVPNLGLEYFLWKK